MTGSEMRFLRQQIGLTLGQAALLAQCTRDTVSKAETQTYTTVTNKAAVLDEIYRGITRRAEHSPTRGLLFRQPVLRR